MIKNVEKLIRILHKIASSHPPFKGGKSSYIFYGKKQEINTYSHLNISQYIKKN